MNPQIQRLVLTGASGLLGSALREDAAARRLPWLVLPHAGLLAAAASLDLRPGDLLVHAGANTDIEACEREPALCYRDNLLLTEALVRRAVRKGCGFVFISSTGVYGKAKSTPYSEFDAAHPTTHHHRSKLLAEEDVLRHDPQALVLRTNWLFGGRASNPRNFVAQCIAQARAVGEGSLASNAVQRGNPTWTVDLIRQLWLLVQAGHCGRFNVVGSGNTSRSDYVSEIVHLAGLPATVQPTVPCPVGHLAAVPNNEMADNLKARLLGLPEMPHWRDSLARYVRLLDIPAFEETVP